MSKIQKILASVRTIPPLPPTKTTKIHGHVYLHDFQIIWTFLTHFFLLACLKYFEPKFDIFVLFQKISILG